MTSPHERQQILDEEHLRLLSIGYYVSGATYSIMALFPLIYVVAGAFFVFGGSRFPAQPGGPDTTIVGWVFIVVGLALTLGFGVVSSLQLWVGRCLKLRRSRTLCLVTAGLSCVFVPFGTMLGIFTFIVLERRTVAALFLSPPFAPPPYPLPPQPPLPPPPPPNP